MLATMRIQISSANATHRGYDPDWLWLWLEPNQSDIDSQGIREASSLLWSVLGRGTRRKRSGMAVGFMRVDSGDCSGPISGHFRRFRGRPPI